MTRYITYGPGGYDPTKPNNNVIDEHDVPDDLTDDDRSEVDKRIAALEAKVHAAEALATKANATAQEVAQAMKNAKGPP